MLAGLAKPAFLRDAAGRLVYGNPAYHELAATLGRRGSPARPAELIDADPRGRPADGKPQSTLLTLGSAGLFELVEYPVAGGTAGYLQPRTQPNSVAATVARDAGLSHLSVIIDALATPIAIFNARRELVQANRAYAVLGSSTRLAEGRHGQAADPRQVAHRQRAPARPDYHGWRARHLKSTTSRPRSVGTCPTAAPSR